jgi:hypothetical protein
MSTEECILCGIEGTPWKHVKGHVCIDCANRDKWISVKEKLPDSNEKVLAINRGLTDLARFEETHWFSLCSNSIVRNAITHWMELPDAPI